MVSDAEKATMLAAIEKQAMEYAKSKGVNITPNVEALIHKKRWRPWT
jgi:hypothetical protein